MVAWVCSNASWWAVHPSSYRNSLSVPFCIQCDLLAFAFVATSSMVSFLATVFWMDEFNSPIYHFYIDFLAIVTPRQWWQPISLIILQMIVLSYILLVILPVVGDILGIIISVWSLSLRHVILSLFFQQNHLSFGLVLRSIMPNICWNTTASPGILLQFVIILQMSLTRCSPFMVPCCQC